jgi:aminoglycoside phosphotransferase (APT) family kinase protein
VASKLTVDTTREREAFAQLAEALRTGSRVVDKRRLRGGIGARMHAITLLGRDGTRSRCVVRRYVRGQGSHGSPGSAAREFRTLQVLAGNGIAAPRPLLLDRDGSYFNAPTIVESLVRGRTDVTPRDFGRWAKGLASALYQIHNLTPETADLSHLDTFLGPRLHAELATGLSGHSSKAVDLHGNELAVRAHESLNARFPSLTWLEPCLVHNDYYPGNVLWARGRVSGVVDWSTAEVGDRRADVAQCRVDLSLMHDGEIADRFLADYEAVHGKPLPDMAFWDIFLGLRAYGSYPRWLRGYHDLGLTHLTADDLRQRIESLLSRALPRL